MMCQSHMSAVTRAMATLPGPLPGPGRTLLEHFLNLTYKEQIILILAINLCLILGDIPFEN